VERPGGVTLLGEVRFPGKYSLSVARRSNRADASRRLTDLAFEEGAVFTRREAP